LPVLLLNMPRSPHFTSILCAILLERRHLCCCLPMFGPDLPALAAGNALHMRTLLSEHAAWMVPGAPSAVTMHHQHVLCAQWTM
jgi:hypothetical protein